jgi:hypothetical protein
LYSLHIYTSITKLAAENYQLSDQDEGRVAAQ